MWCLFFICVGIEQNRPLILVSYKMAKKSWTEEERHDLIRKLNADLEDFMEECSKKPKFNAYDKWEDYDIDQIWEVSSTLTVCSSNKLRFN